MTAAEEYEQEILDWLQATAKESLTSESRDRIYDALNSWLSFTARKRPVGDLAVRMENFRKRIRALADDLTIEVGKDGYVVKATGDADSALRQLKRGTDWFDPVGNLSAMIVGAVFERT